MKRGQSNGISLQLGKITYHKANFIRSCDLMDLVVWLGFKTKNTLEDCAVSLLDIRCRERKSYAPIKKLFRTVHRTQINCLKIVTCKQSVVHCHSLKFKSSSKGPCLQGLNSYSFGSIESDGDVWRRGLVGDLLVRALPWWEHWDAIFLFLSLSIPATSQAVHPVLFVMLYYLVTGTRRQGQLIKDQSFWNYVEKWSFSL